MAVKVCDGEEGVIPVLSRRVLVQESLALPIRNAGTKNFDFTKLRESGKSDVQKDPARAGMPIRPRLNVARCGKCGEGRRK